MGKEQMKTLLIVPPFSEIIYGDSKVKVGVPGSPPVSVAALAGQLLKDGVEVRIIDLNLCENHKTALQQELSSFKPRFVGITFTTPLFKVMCDVAAAVKTFDPGIVVIGGGPHASAMPADTLASSPLDIVVVGEGDFVLPEIVSGKALSEIRGIAYKESGKVVATPRPDYIQDLDKLPFPAWHLLDIQKYRSPHFMVKKNPSGWIETSRGCPFNCCYCNKSVFGRTFRVKSPARVVAEMERMLGLGFKELHIVDDMFSTDVDRVKAICRMVIEKKLDFPWATLTGIRVDRGDQEMFNLMAEAGCYRVYFGIESGNQQILNNIGKDADLKQVVNAVRMAKNAGLETCGFFVFALPGETEETMRQTTDFAIALDLDLAKLSVMIPLPATRVYDELEAAGRLRTKDWTKYNLYMPANEIYEHANLKWDIVEKYFNTFYRRFYLRPGFIWRRFMAGIRHGTLLTDALYFLRTRW